MFLNHLKTKLPLLTIYTLLILIPCQTFAQDSGPICGETPSDILLMLDRTGSVSDEERAKEAAAAQRLVELLLVNTKNRVAIGAFGPSDCLDLSPAEILAPLSNATGELQEVITRGMETASCGFTNLYDALLKAHQELDFGHNPNRVIILISDGNPNLPAYPQNPSQLALESAETMKGDGIRIFSIAFDAANHNDVSNRQLLANIASNHSSDDTEGLVDAEEQQQENADGDDFFIAPTAADLDRVFKSIGEIILCDDGDPCTLDSCGGEGRCHYEANPACEIPEPSCQEAACQPKVFQETEIGETWGVESTPDLQTNPVGANMVQGGGLACSLTASTGSADLGLMLMGLSSLSGGFLLFRRPR